MQPPHDIRAERALLGAMLLDDKRGMYEAFEVVGQVSGYDQTPFYNDRHGAVYYAIQNLEQRGKAVDLVTLTNELQELGKLDYVGGPESLLDIRREGVESTHAKDYAQIVMEKYLSREIASLGRDITGLALSEEKDSEGLLETVEQKLYNLRARKGLVSESPYQVAGRIVDEILNPKLQKRGIPSGLKSLDQVLGGWRNSQLICLAGRPGQGKSAALLHFLIHAARLGYVCPLFTLEMSSTQMTYRMLANLSGVNSKDIERNTLQPEEIHAVIKAREELKDINIPLFAIGEITPLGIRAKLRQLATRFNLGPVGVDYMQLLAPPEDRKNSTREQDVGRISRSLKATTMSLDIPIIGLSQMSRAVEGRANKLPQLSDLRESGSLEQDSDIVIFLYYPDEQDQSRLQFIAAKQRGGEAPVAIDAVFEKPYSRFKEPAMVFPDFAPSQIGQPAF